MYQSKFQFGTTEDFSHEANKRYERHELLVALLWFVLAFIAIFAVLEDLVPDLTFVK